MPHDVTDEWTPAFDRIVKALSDQAQQLALTDLGYRLVLRVKQLIQRQVGFADLTAYKKLRIKWRYHGQKTLVNNAKNRRRRARGTEVTADNVTVVDKTRVTAATKALIDLGDLLRSWDVVYVSPKRVDVAPKTPAEMAKAYYNDDRGDWSWSGGSSGENSTDFAFRIYVDHFDRNAGFSR